MQILSSTPMPSGFTRIVVDVDGVNRATLSILTSQVHTLSEQQLLQLLQDSLAVERPRLG